MSTEQKPDTPSGDYAAMCPYWDTVSAIMGGAATMRAEERLLPRFPQESAAAYKFRRECAKFTNVYSDLVENLAQRPFAKQVELVGDSNPPQQIEEFVADVDGRGTKLHGFAGDMFEAAVAYGIDWLLVDYTANVPAGATVAQERAMGARPYWVRYPARSVLAAYSDVIEGREQFTHVRLWEPVTVRAGFGEETVPRVRILNREPIDGGGYAPATWEVWQKVKDAKTDVADWVMIEGPTPLTIDSIPLVPFMTGRRTCGWQFRPPMRGACDLQVELYQQESALKHIKTLSAFPMLSASGVQPTDDGAGKPEPVPVGPMAVLYAPPYGDGNSGEWKFIEPGAQSMRFLADDIAATIKELRELGRQPLTAQSGNLTVVTTAVAAQKGNSAVQAWAQNLEAALEEALWYTAQWLRLDGYEPDVAVDKEFDLGFGDDASFDQVLAMYEQGTVSREALIHEAKRRGILDDGYDADEDMDEIIADMRGDDADRADALGAPGGSPSDGADAL